MPVNQTNRNKPEPVRNGIETLAKLTAAAHEATERGLRATIAAMEVQALRYETAIEKISQGVCFFDGEQRLILCNRRYAEMYRLTPEQIPPGTTLREIAEHRMVAGTSTMATNDYVDWCTTVSVANEPKVWVADLKDGRTIHVCHQPMPDGGWVATHEDITAIKATRPVADERISLQTLIDWVPDYLWVKDKDSRFVFANKALAFDNGRDRTSEMVGLSDFDLHGPDIAQQFYDAEQSILNSGQPVLDTEEVIIDASGSTKWMSSTKVPLRNEQNEIVGLVGIARDITPRKELETARKALELQAAQSVQRLNTTLENFPGGICMFNKDFVLTVANRGFYDITQLDEHWFPVGSTLQDIFRFHATRGEYGEGDVDDLVAQRMDDARMLTASKFLHIRPLDGVTLEYSRTPLEQGGYVLTVEDITQKLASDQQKAQLERELSHAQKMESLGTLASGVAHEINTPIQYVGDNIRFAQDSFDQLVGLLKKCRGALAASGSIEAIAEIDKDARQIDLDFLIDEVPQSLSQSLEGIAQVASIVKAIKEFSHPGQEDAVDADINAVIETTLVVSRNQWKYVAEVAVDFDTTLPLVNCHPGDINQVILNLVVNAAQAIGEKGKEGPGRIEVSTRRAQGFVEISVRDNGCGIPPHVINRIFDPFFTTKDVGKGTGQGLAICFAIVTGKHGGTIDCVSAPGEGTTFTVRLPISGKAAEAELVA
ncbi:PAS-domain containing protein [Devosia sp.]|uniref:PAS-domain containing protein n=1 Tax=Devosia sp. TaxID=1871048 RepID=UPI0032679778